jgi:hypothetical protein
MNKEELVKFLKENLRIESKEESPSFGHGGGLEIMLYLCDEEIASTWISLPN